MTWEELNSYIARCNGCKLCETRKNVVIGRGSHKEGGILFVGEGPGEHEDNTGIPFSGQAGKLLDLALEACGFDGDSYYIANVVKCRPPENRNPLPEEVNPCMQYLRAQFSMLKPKIVVLLGSVAAKNLLATDEGITKLRGTEIVKGNTIFMPTYHPAAILRDESKKLDFYRDLNAIWQKFEAMKEN